ncbi:MAG: tetratricopeptide repeat protein [Treponema sp.]|nr:tetratricopeptide repeat protein [Treponema sp.]
MAGKIKYCCIVLFFIFFPLCAQNIRSNALSNALEAYRLKEWQTAVFMFKKAYALKEYISPETAYMTIIAEINCEKYDDAAQDCDLFLISYADSLYAPYVRYQRGRCSFYLGEYNRAVLLLSDFCHENEGHEMYPSALYWMAESFYAGYNYDSAKPLYERIVSDFATSEKYEAACFRLEIIEQHLREKKLVYLLHKTGEDYLAAKEDYEKQLRVYKTEGLVGLQRELKTEKDKNASLTAEVEELRLKNAELQKKVGTVTK